MKIVVLKDKKAQGQAVAALFAADVLTNQHPVLGFATGSSPLPTYAALIDLYKANVLDFSNVTTFNLDEYVGIPAAHEQSYYTFMRENLFTKVNVDLSRCHLPNANAADPALECRQYEQAITKAGGIDIQLLGIGLNGHIGFNEPSDVFPDQTNVVALTDSTIEANTRFFASRQEVPRYAMTMGIGTILRAKKIVLVISGKDKAEITKAALQGPIVPQVPASILQTHHNVVVVLDEGAASLL